MNSKSRARTAPHDLEAGLQADFSAHSGRLTVAELAHAPAKGNSARIQKTLGL